jgi:hypothetical protein
MRKLLRYDNACCAHLQHLRLRRQNLINADGSDDHVIKAFTTGNAIYVTDTFSDYYTTLDADDADAALLRLDEALAGIE